MDGLEPCAMSAKKGAMRIVRSRSISNVDTERLLNDLDRLHSDIHTSEGLADFNGSRRKLVEIGVKIKMICTELAKREAFESDCEFCQPFSDGRTTSPLKRN